MTILRQLQVETLRSEMNFMRMEAASLKKVLYILDALEKEIVTQLATVDPTAPKLTAYKQARLQKLQKAVKSLIRDGYRAAQKVFNGELEMFADEATRSVAYAIDTVLGVQLAGVSLPTSLLNKLVDDTLVQTAPSADWWARQDVQLTQRFYDQMRVGLAKGDTLDELIKRVRGVPARDGKMAISGIMDISRRNAAALVRTATQSITNQARIDAMVYNSDVIKGVQWLATLDNRTTQICRDLDGKTWYVNKETREYRPNGHTMEFPGPTAHWGCRSVVLPWLKSWEEMTAAAGGDTAFARKLDAMLPGTRSSLDGQVPAALTYREWEKLKTT